MKVEVFRCFFSLITCVIINLNNQYSYGLNAMPDVDLKYYSGRYITIDQDYAVFDFLFSYLPFPGVASFVDASIIRFEDQIIGLFYEPSTLNITLNFGGSNPPGVVWSVHAL